MRDRPVPSDDAMDPGERFAALVAVIAQEPGVTPPDASRSRFGSSALKVNGSIFAMLTRGRLVVKLPRDRVNALIQEGIGAAFDAGKGAPMKEWLTVLDDADDMWRALALEALAFVGRRSEHR